MYFNVYLKMGKEFRDPYNENVGSHFSKESGLFDPLNILLPSSWMLKRERERENERMNID